MSLGTEELQKGSQIFFQLLSNRILGSDSEYYQIYYNVPEIKEVVTTLAKESNTQIIQAHNRLHLVSKKDESIFATNFTHLKSKYSEIENKKYFHLISTIIMVFLAEVDKEKATQLKWQQQGMTFYSIEHSVSKLLSHWDAKLKDNDTYGIQKGVNMREIIDLWNGYEIKIEGKKLSTKIRPNKKSKLGFITTAFNLLEDEKLVFVADKDDIPKVIPKTELYERLQYLYHNHDRYQEFKEIIEKDIQDKED
ncbi:DUF6063 family protein [Bacillus sp. CECT 9360]|uniref:DUF6063 family protein n=1 Tax=Bacillus sp. CECT 9360 TaxID=2845821 RepID=UPI001E5F1A5E|nr:DUF6063 family protein [Bacillus sp. CECT 9360]CAH0345730.1 hypothetical protein BCI9360_02028 [Bacillus sp. CECT 9360]